MRHHILQGIPGSMLLKYEIKWFCHATPFCVSTVAHLCWVALLLLSSGTDFRVLLFFPYPTLSAFQYPVALSEYTLDSCPFSVKNLYKICSRCIYLSDHYYHSYLFSSFNSSSSFVSSRGPHSSRPSHSVTLSVRTLTVKDTILVHR